MKQEQKKRWESPRVERHGTFVEATAQTCKYLGGSDGSFLGDPGSPLGTCS